MADEETKRLNVLVPKALFEKFQEYSQKEYKNTTTMVIDWMVGYVAAREKLSFRNQAFLEFLFRLLESFERLIDQSEPNQDRSEIASLWRTILERPELTEKPEMLGRLIALEKRLEGLNWKASPLIQA